MWEQVHQALQQSVHRAVFQVATLLPGVLALAVALVISLAVAWLLAMIVRRILTGIHFDSRADKWGLSGVSEWSSSNTPTSLVTRIVFWTAIIAGIFVGLAAFDAASAFGLSAFILAYITRILAAILILLVGVVVARFLSRSVLINGVNMNLQHARLLSLGVKWLVLVFTAAMVLDHLGIARSIVDMGFGILFGGIVLALALAVGLGSRDLVSRSLEREREKTLPDEDIVHHF